MDAQEAELANLREELASIRDRFVFPLPPSNAPKGSAGNQLDNARVDKDIENSDVVDEDLMPTPRPPAGPHCAESQTMRGLVDSLESAPATPFFQQVMHENVPFEDWAEVGSAGDSGHSEDILHPSVFSDSGPSTPSNEPSRGSLYVVNPDSDSEKEGVTERDKGKLEELVTARDALRSALAAMDPVKTQLKAVEDELKLRGLDAS
jgi:hypothetical protein